jgi:hypothetical protein
LQRLPERTTFFSGQWPEGNGIGMYEAFDSFLAVGTWHTNHDADGRRFYEALSRVVRDPKFSPDRMGEYVRQKTGTKKDHPFEDDISRLVSNAWAVRDYLQATED